jgi:hypothetical protein
MLRGPKSLKTALSAAVATAIGLTPALMFASPAAATSSVLTITASPVTEGSNVSFVLHYTGVAAATYNLVTAAGTATPGSDYSATPSSTQVTFAAAPVSDQTVTVATTDDALYEGATAETFTLTATNSVTGSDNVTATGTINDNDTAPSYTLTASPTTVAESASPAQTTVTAKLSAVSGVDTVVTLNTVNGTAVAGTSPNGDYTALVNSQITIPAGSLQQTKVVSITADTVKDQYDTETFTVNAVATNVSPTTASATISITDAQSTPVLTLTGGGPALEGNNLTFTVNATPGSELPISAHWDAVTVTPQTGHDNATPGTDFTYPSDSSRTVTIAPGQTQATISIPLTADQLNENPEDFAVKLSAPTNATLGTAIQVTGTITDADSALAPSVAISPTTVVEGDSGRRAQVFTATLNRTSGRTVTVLWATGISGTGSGFATAGKDYATASGKLVFPAGTTTQTFSVDIIGDTIDEGAAETFDVNLTSPAMDTSATLTNGGVNLITITDDDAAPTYTFDNLTMKEGNATTAQLLPIKVSNPSDHDLWFSIDDGTHTPTATADDSDPTDTTPGASDYQILTPDVLIPAGMTTGYAVIQVNGDTVFEGDETAYLDADVENQSTNYVTAPQTKQSTVILQNDDTAPNLEINSITGNEGDTVHVTGTVTGVAQANTYVTVSFAGATVSGSKAADANDFTNPGSIVVPIPAGTTSGASVPVADVMLTTDTLAEPAETILVTGMGLANSATVTSGVITIAASNGGGGTTTTPPPTNPTGDLTLVADKTIVQGVGSVNLHGKATAGASVQLWAKPVGNTTLVSFGAPVTADAQGDYSFNAPLTKNGIVFAATSGDMTSDQVTVWIQEVPTVAGGSATKGKVSLTVTTGNPAIANTVVTIQRANSDGSWTTIASGTTNSSGKWTKTWSGLASGSSMTVRAWAAGNGPIGLLSGNSATKTVKVM